MSTNPYVAWEGPADDDEQGAFAVQSEVTWSNGFGDEDLAGASPARAQTAPRPAAAPAPVQAPAPAPVAVPVAPAPAVTRPPLTGDTEVPSWAQVRPTQPAPAPVAPVQAPVATPTPAPAPIPAQAPTAAPLAPPTPAPVRPDLAGDTEVPAWAQVRPTEPAPQAPAAPAPSPAQPQPAPAVPRWDEPAAHTVVPAPAQDPVLAPAPLAAPPVAVTPPLPVPPQQPDPTTRPVYATAEETDSRRARKGKGKTRPAKAPKAAKSSQAMAGGRWKTKILRGSIYTVVGLLLLGGLKNVVVPSAKPNTDAIAASVRTSLGDTGFPTTAGEGFALRFASVYLAYDPDTQEERAKTLQQYSQEASENTWGWTGSTGKQKIVAGPVLAAKAVVKDKHFATVTVAAQVSSGSWVYLAVPLYASDKGALVVSGPPAFVAPPARAASPGGDGVNDPDTTLAQTLTTDVLPGFFKAWAASNVVDLARYTSKDATPAASTGLAGAMTLAQVGEVQVPKAGGDTRVGQVAVTWAIPGAGTYAQTYQVTVTKDASDKWSVKDITGGVIADTATKGDEGVVPAAGEDAPAN